MAELAFNCPFCGKRAHAGSHRRTPKGIVADIFLSCEPDCLMTDSTRQEDARRIAGVLMDAWERGAAIPRRTVSLFETTGLRLDVGAKPRQPEPDEPTIITPGDCGQ